MRQLLLIIALSVLHSQCKVVRFKRDNPQPETNGTQDALSSLPSELGCPKGSDYVCNLHNPKYKCTCFRPNKLTPMQYPTCDSTFQIQNVRAYVIELRTKLPQEPNVVNNFDEFLADLIDDYCAIPPKFLLILRKRCTNNEMQVQIAFLRANEAPVPKFLGISDLQAIHPDIFRKNEEFMAQDFLPILGISEVDFLTPLIRQMDDQPHPNQPKMSDTNKNMNEIGFVVLFALIILIANLIPICILWRIVCDRRTRASKQTPPPSQI